MAHVWPNDHCNPQVLFSRAAPQPAVFQLCWHMGSPHPQCNTLCFLLSFLRLLLAQSPSFSRSFWTELPYRSAEGVLCCYQIYWWRCWSKCALLLTCGILCFLTISSASNYWLIFIIIIFSSFELFGVLPICNLGLILESVKILPVYCLCL